MPGEPAAQTFVSHWADLRALLLMGTNGMLASMSDVARIPLAICSGDAIVLPQLFQLIYDELRTLAAAKMAHEKPGNTLDATGLVHEAYLRMVGDQQFENRKHFYAAAAEAMRRILVDRARARMSLKRGGATRRDELQEIAEPDPDRRLLALDEGLAQLATEDLVAARVVELHHFAGMSHDMVAAALELSIYEVRKKWAFARAWLKSVLEES